MKREILAGVLMIALCVAAGVALTVTADAEPHDATPVETLTAPAVQCNPVDGGWLCKPVPIGWKPVPIGWIPTTLTTESGVTVHVYADDTVVIEARE